MVSKQWQRSQTYIAHAGLVVVAAPPFAFLETSLTFTQIIGWTLVAYAILFPLIWLLHRRYASTFVKVFRCDYEMAARIVQRALNAERLMFSKRMGNDCVVFSIRPNQTIAVDAFDLNMMVDSHIDEVIATKVTIEPETSENAEQLQRLRNAIDKAFAAQGR